ncbi:hypothetical protein ACQKWADRAFT_302425 [Trichoderma austrokoningii]
MRPPYIRLPPPLIHLQVSAFFVRVFTCTYSSVFAMALADYSCQSCQKRKKRCSKQLPECAACVRMKKPCQYPQRKTTALSGNTGNNDLSSPEALTNRFPPSFFIDPIMFESCGVQIPQGRIAIPNRITEYLEDIALLKILVAGYFKSVHHWIPVISRIRLHNLVSNPRLYEQEPDSVLLLLSIKLIASTPDQSKSTSEVYTIAKQFFFMVEAAGCLTLQMVQAGIMIALYELGHGIYPAVFSTIATCARYGTALGIDDLKAADLTSAGGEEKVRVWWGVLIVDHILNIGVHGRQLSTQGPKSNQPLPMDDDDWDRLIATPREPQRLSNPTELKAGSFARTAQAINLLSQVFQYLGNLKAGLQLEYEHLDQLNRTILSLSNLVEEESAQRGILLCCPVGFCSNALLLINTPYLDGIKPARLTDEQSYRSRQLVLSEIEKTRIIAEEYLAGERGTVDQTCPLFLSWLYRAAATATFIYQETNDIKHQEQSLSVQNAIQDISQKWHVAASYLQLLETRQFMTMAS